MPVQEGYAYVLAARPWGEGGTVATLFCPENGLLKGLLKRARAADLQPFNTLQYRHTRRLESQLGVLQLELVRSRAALWLGGSMNGGRRALAVAAAAETLAVLLPEGHPYPAVLRELEHLLESGFDWRSYARFERALLAEIGYGLQLEDPVPCAAGSPLTYVSPTTLRSVPALVARGYEHRLYTLPQLWGGPAMPETADCAAALGLTGTLLTQALHGPFAAEKLASRARLVQAYLAELASSDAAKAA